MVTNSNMNRVLSLLMVTGLMWLSHHSYCQDNLPPNPEKWLETYLKEQHTKPNIAHAIYPHNVVFIERFRNHQPPKMLNVNRHKFDQLGFLKTPETKFLKFYFDLNTKPKSYERKSPFRHNIPERWLFAVGNATHANLVIDTSSNWEAYQIGENKAQKVFELDGGSQDSDRLISWLTKGLGYDAVILERKGQWYLVGTFTRPKNVGAQALAIANSHDKIAIPRPKGDGLLELVRIGREASVYRIIVPGSAGDNIAIGTKLGTENLNLSQ